MHQLSARPFIATIDGLLSAAECEQWIAWAEGIGFHAAALVAQHGITWDDRVRNNERVMVDDAERAELLFARLPTTLPRYRGWAAVGCNERIRVYRYGPGQRFRKHRDSHFKRPGGERSRLTLLVYLNEGYQGGQTWFERATVQPKQGMALLFDHDQDHAGVAVDTGVKYVVRTDVMYYPDPSRHD
jgi:prolyl 4-hydroxylase